MSATATDVKHELTPEEKQNLLLAGVGPLQKNHSFPRFTRLTGAMLRKLVNAGAVHFPEELSEDGADDGLPVMPEWENSVFKGEHDQQALAFLEQFPKFIAEGYVGNCGTGTISIDTVVSESKLTRKEVLAFANLFHRADEFLISDKELCEENHETLFAYAWFD